MALKENRTILSAGQPYHNVSKNYIIFKYLINNKLLCFTVQISQHLYKNLYF